MSSFEDTGLFLQSSDAKVLFGELYGPENITAQQNRYINLLGKLTDIAEVKEVPGREEVFLLSAPGRTELGGNHTDHNHGRVLAASVDLDSICAVIPAAGNNVTIISEGYPDPFTLSLDNLSPGKDEEGSTTALIRGIAAFFQESGYHIGGFTAVLSSNVLPGSGLSSSASIEVLIAGIFSHLFNGGEVHKLFLAEAGQFAENRYFGKPCGLMDQIACAWGGIVAIDFKDPSKPHIEEIHSPLSLEGYDLVVLDTGGDHVDLTPDYAAVPWEMKALAKTLGKETCRELSEKEVFSQIFRLRKQVGDRAILRYFHFIDENRRVGEQSRSLKEGDMERFLSLVQSSGDSSWKLLQNTYSPGTPEKQGIPLALALSKKILKGKGACRVHGGGFAGTIQAYVPKDQTREYRGSMESVFGAGSVTTLKIREAGIISLTCS